MPLEKTAVTPLKKESKKLLSAIEYELLSASNEKGKVVKARLQNLCSPWQSGGCTGPPPPGRGSPAS